MDKMILKENRVITVSSNELETSDLSFEVNGKVTLIIKTEGDKPLTLNVEANVNRDSDFTCLLLNNTNGKLILNDNYCLENDSNSVIAYSQLNEYEVLTNSNYDLKGQGASLRVLSVSLNGTKKVFNQNTQHLASYTSANIENFGVVLSKGNTSMVVKNTINKDTRECKTHQTSRLLTYDKTALGKILPILYIDDNEVEASHACSLGQPDENQIYYLMSRGLDRNEALQLITIGYLLPITKIISDDSVNELLANEIERKVISNVSNREN